MKIRFYSRFFILTILIMLAGYSIIGCSDYPTSDNVLMYGSTAISDISQLDSILADEYYPPMWLQWTTDGSSSIECSNSYIASGAKCDGRYCDNVSLLGSDSGYNQTNSWWTSYFSEEGENQRICENNGFVTGIKCSGSYCDNISLRCSQLDNGGTRQNCYWTASLSEENGGKFVAPQSMYIAGVRCSGRYCDNKQFYLCKASETANSIDLNTLAHQFAPRLRFDQEFGTGSGEQSKCFPSDPEVYYKQTSLGINPIALCNQDYSTISGNQVPIFYMAKQCGTNTIIIRYWFFYAWQSTCFATLGSHAADWESVAVMIVNGELKRVAYYQHGGWYTRNEGNFETVNNTHPVAYVGKNAHGSYHDDGGSGGCLYFEDFRNPGGNDYHMDTWNKLVVIERGEGVPSWMNCNGSDCFDGIGHPIDQTGELCGFGGCNSDGCDRSNIGHNIPFINDPLGSDYSRITAKHSGKVIDVEGASTDNGTNVSQYDYWGTDNQRWLLEVTSDGYVMMKAKHCGKCLDIAGASTEDGANVVQYNCNGNSNQSFKLINKGSGYFSLQAKHSNKCLDIAGSSMDNGGNVNQWSCQDSDNQIFYFGQ